MITPRLTLPVAGLAVALASCSAAPSETTDTVDTSTGDSTTTDVPTTTPTTTTVTPTTTSDTDTTTADPSTGSESATDSATDSESDTESETESDTDPGDPVIELDGPCDLGVTNPSRLAVLTNNFIDARLHSLDLETRTLTPNLAQVSSDPALAWGAGKLVVINRFNSNTLDVFKGDSLDLLYTVDVAVADVANPNPQHLAFSADGHAYLTLFASPLVPIYDFDLPPGENFINSFDLTNFADRDGSPEAGATFICGQTLFVAIQRLVEFMPVDLSYFVAIDLATGEARDYDPNTPEVEALGLLGPWPKHVRLDPQDPAGHHVLVLTSGIERVDLTRGTSTWAVTPERLADVGITGFDPIAFAIAEDATSIYLLATDGEYPTAAVFHIGLDDHAPVVPTPIASLLASDKVIERVDNVLWIGDAEDNSPSLRSFDLSQSPPVELDPIPTPNTPYQFLPIP